jgi:hypothetical protein
MLYIARLKLERIKVKAGMKGDGETGRKGEKENR